MKHNPRSLPRIYLGSLLASGCALMLGGPAGAATVTFSTTAPIAGASGVSNLVGTVTSGSTANQKKSNAGAGDDNAVYLDNGRPIQGQTFKTGTNANGYLLSAVSLRQVTYNTYALVPDMNYHIRVTIPAITTLTVLAEETGFAPEDSANCSTCNFPNLGCCNQGAGSGRYITLTLGTNVVLNPNTTYGFDVGATSVGDHYWETDGRSCTPSGPGCNAVDLYTNGTAYSSGVFPNGYGKGLGDTSMTVRSGDRVFVVTLSAAATPVGPRIHIQPQSVSLFAGRTVQFIARASGSPTLNYQWRKNGINIGNGGNISGAQTDSLTISNITSGDIAAYTLVVTNSASSANSVTSAPATLTVIAAPPAGGYASAVLSNNPVAYWRLDDSGNPATNAPAYDYAGGLIGAYEVGSSNGFNGVVGPRPSGFPGFASTNSAVQTTGTGDGLTPTWVTIPPLNLFTNTVTMTAWIHPNGVQADYAGLLMSTSDAGLAYGGSFSANAGQLIYWWNSASTYTFVSGLTIPSDQWSFVAAVIEPTKATLYLGATNTLSTAVNSTAHTVEPWAGNGHIGHQATRSPDDRVFSGSIDEVAVFNRALTFDQINTLYGIGRGVVQPVPPSIVVQPTAQSVYAGRTARFSASAIGSSPLTYRWRKNGVNLNDGGNISGATTNALTIANAAAGDVGTYTLVVTNTTTPPANAVTSAPVTLTLAAPSGKAYEAAVLAANPVAYWRLNEKGDPSTNTAAFDYWGSLAGVYSLNAQNGFNGILGPQPTGFPEFETNNTALEAMFNNFSAYVTVPPLNLNTNTVTITAWINPNSDPITSYAALFYSRRGSADPGGVGLSYTDSNQIGYTWNNGSDQTWTFLSELRPPANQWSFVALVVEPSQATLYLYNTNGLSSTNNPIPHVNEAWDGTSLIGADDNHLDRAFDGIIDEVAVFKYAFTPAQVLHLYNSAFAAAPPSVTLNIQKVGANIQLSWSQGTLLEANAVTGPYTTNTATSPYLFAPTGAAKFFRVKVQ